MWFLAVSQIFDRLTRILQRHRILIRDGKRISTTSLSLIGIYNISLQVMRKCSRVRSFVARHSRVDGQQRGPNLDDSTDSITQAGRRSGSRRMISNDGSDDEEVGSPAGRFALTFSNLCLINTSSAEAC